MRMPPPKWKKMRSPGPEICGFSVRTACCAAMRCCSRADLDRVLDGQPADMVFTDPPYNVDYAPEDRDGNARRIANDNLGEDFPEFLRQVCTHLVACGNGAIYIAMSSSELHKLKQAFCEAGGHWSTFLIWAKDRFTLGFSDYQRQYEPILYGWPEGKQHYWAGARDQGDVWNIARPFMKQAAPDHEAGGTGGASRHQQQPPGCKRCSMCLGGSGHHPDRLREGRTKRTADRTRPEVCGCDREALAGSGFRSRRCWKRMDARSRRSRRRGWPVAV